jgi:hypothetical protein
MRDDRVFTVGETEITLASNDEGSTPDSFKIDFVRAKNSSFSGTESASRQELFEAACALLCTVIDSEPAGVFDTSWSLDTNSNAVARSNHVRDLLDKTSSTDPATAVTDAVQMFRRLESRLPVLQACQRALETNVSEFDVNILHGIAGRMERNLPVDTFISETNGSTVDGEVVKDTTEPPSPENILEMDFKEIPPSAVKKQTGWETEDTRRWFRPCSEPYSLTARLAKKLNLFLMAGDNNTAQLRSDLITPTRSVDKCMYSPVLGINDLEKYFWMAEASYLSFFKSNEEVFKTGEVPVASHAIKLFMGAPEDIDLH